MAKKVFELNFKGKKLVVEHGQMAKQANGSVLVRYEDTVILCAAVMNKTPVAGDFFPLTVRYEEKLYSVGKIPGGFIKRESRPSDAATLTSRLIDRPIRPLFADGFRNEVQVIATVLSVDNDHTPEMTAMLGSSLALSVSNIPFDGPIAGVIVGRVDGQLIINPTITEMEKSDIDLKVAGTKYAINMVEASAKQVAEDDMLEALMFGHEAIKELVKFQEEIIKAVGIPKVKVPLMEIDPEVEKEVRTMAKEKMSKAIIIKDKLEKYAAIDQVKEDVTLEFEEKHLEEEDLIKKLDQVKKILEDVEMDEVRRLVNEENVRSDGRKMNEIRPLESEIDILPRTHGSAMFTRGQTQSLSVTTLGALNEHQILDGLTIDEEKRFMLHYNFPQFSVGETGRYGAPGRREIGHGALGERALLQVMPDETEFPYTVRVVSETLESNGSSSQASICAGCMSLMAAGVPIKAPVAGIAMGLITQGDKYKVLTDIQGIEDHLGDMDFKVAGTKDGICALQMDIKIKGITKEIIKEALYQAKEARLQILDHMAKTIKEPRKELGKYAPKTETIYINPDKIKDVIGRGGEVITKIIQDVSNVVSVNEKNAIKIDIEDDGRILFYHMSYEVIDKAVKMIEELTKEPEIGKIYNVKVVKVEDFGAFVELWPGCEGLVHVSQLDHKRVEKPSDLVKVGDEIIVKATGYDKRGKLNLSRKEALPKPVIKETPKSEPETTPLPTTEE